MVREETSKVERRGNREHVNAVKEREEILRNRLRSRVEGGREKDA